METDSAYGPSPSPPPSPDAAAETASPSPSPDEGTEEETPETAARSKCEETMAQAPEAIKKCMASVCKENVITLSQADFADGTYIIDRPGLYQLAEDIVFEPHGDGVDESMMPTHDNEKYPLKNGYWLGFFAAIAIQCENVFLDMNGKAITQSPKHHMMQRFFTNIQLGSKPFQAKTGPPQFSTSKSDVIAANKVVVTGGTLGRSSHMGIHGNKNEDIWVHDMIVKDFETGGIQLNGGRHVYITNTEVGPSYSCHSQYDMPAATLSQANLLLRILELEHAEKVDQKPFQELKSARDSFIAGDCGSECDIFRLPKEDDGAFLPDGGALYGILLHNEQLPIHDFLVCSTSPEKEDDREMFGPLEMTNVYIHNLRLRADEVVATNMTGRVLGPAGDVVQMLRIRDANGNYVGNVLSDAQFELAAAAAEAGGGMTADETFAHFGSTHVPDAVLKWSKGEISMAEMLKKEPANYICHKDSMGHHNKGIVGVRLNSMDGVKMSHVTIENLESTGSTRKPECEGTGTYKGNDVRGITAILTPEFKPSKVVIHNLTARHGCVYGMEARHGASCSPADFEVSGLTGETVHETPGCGMLDY